MSKETVTISKKEYELLKKHQQEYGILLATLSDKEEVCEYIKARNRDKYGYFLGIEDAVKVIEKEFKERLKENDTKF
jgi:hypothetical protein